MIVNSDLSHLIDHDLLKKLTIYYTSDSRTLDFNTSIDEKCLWTIIPFLNRYQGTFNQVIRMKNTGIIGELRNDAGGRYSTMIREMFAKQEVIHKAKELLAEMENY